MNVFNIICQVILYSCVVYSIGLFVFYKIRQRKDRKKKESEVQQEELNKEIKDEEGQDISKE